MMRYDPEEGFRQVAENVKALAPPRVDIEIDASMSTIAFPNVALVIRVIGNSARFDFARAVAVDIFQRERTLLLVDTEQPRVSIWDRGAREAHREITSPIEEIDLPVIGCRFALGRLYDGVEFRHFV